MLSFTRMSRTIRSIDFVDRVVMNLVCLRTMSKADRSRNVLLGSARKPVGEAIGTGEECG